MVDARACCGSLSGLREWGWEGEGELWVQAFAWFADLLTEHAEIFWSLFAVDLAAALAVQPADTWDAFPLFQLLNDYLCEEGASLSRTRLPHDPKGLLVLPESLRNGHFHSKLITEFSPMVIRYVDLMEHSVAQSIDKGFAREKWEMRG